MALRAGNVALIDALKAAVYYSDKVVQISKNKRKSMVVSLNGPIAQSEAVYGEAPTRH
jgi:hypothetical protein